LASAGITRLAKDILLSEWWRSAAIALPGTDLEIALSLVVAIVDSARKLITHFFRIYNWLGPVALFHGVTLTGCLWCVVPHLAGE
jgi:hypothetical protein